MAINITEADAIRLSTFTTDENLTPDNFIMFQDIDSTHSTMIDRYWVLKNKNFTTADEKLEMTTLLTNLQEYMPTSDTFNKLCACILTMQMYMRDGIVVFVNEKKDEFNKMLEEFSDKGDWNSTSTYEVGNLVRHIGFGFLSKVDNNINHEPNNEASTDDYWIRFTIKGDKGDPSLNVNYKGDYVATTTYNLGDACTYNGVMYYAKINGTIGVLPTDETKWAYVGNVIVKDTEPVDTHVIWWDTTTNKFKRYTSNLKWESQTMTASELLITDSSNYYTSTNVEDALAEIGSNKISKNTTPTLSSMELSSASPYIDFHYGNSVADYTSRIIEESSGVLSVSNNLKLRGTLLDKNSAQVINAVGTANYVGSPSVHLQLESNNKITANIGGTVKNVLDTDDYNTLFQYANNGKTSIANAVTGKGVTASSSDTFATLATKIGQISQGKSNSGSTTLTFSQGTSTNTASTASYSVDVGFVPKLVTSKNTAIGAIGTGAGIKTSGTTIDMMLGNDGDTNHVITINGTIVTFVLTDPYGVTGSGSRTVTLSWFASNWGL